MTKKFSDLTSIDNLLAEDILAVVDTSETASRYITLANLSASVFSSASAASIIGVLNEYNAGASYGNGLYAGWLWHEAATNSVGTNVPAYKDGNYYLDYNNFTNTPILKTDLKEFDNSASFLRLTPDGIVTSPAANLGGLKRLITTTDIDEASPDSPGVNLYYTLARDQAHLEQNFETQFNIYSGRLVGSNRDSLEAQAATFPEASVTTNQSKTLRFASSDSIDNYIEGQVLRIYGASLADAQIAIDALTTLTFSVTSSQSGWTTTGLDLIEVSYEFALYNTITGEISTPLAPRTVSVKNSNSSETFLQAFSSSTFLKVSYNNIPANHGVLVYRKIASVESSHKLIAVLGEKEVSEGSWKDYMSFDYVSWSGKTADYNTYTTVPHFPLTSVGLTLPLRGWVDKTIVSVTPSDSSDGFDIELDSTAFVNQPINATRAVQVYHNDTELIQNAIDKNSDAGKKSVMLNARPYNVSSITVPNEFGILGTRSVSTIKKLPWSGGLLLGSTGSIIKSTGNPASQISLVGFDIEGNSSYQALFSDLAVERLSANYALDFGTDSNAIILDGVRVRNVSAGGLWAPEATDLGVRSGEFINSGVSDRNPYSPISAPGSKSTFITGNKIKNYSEYVDVATTTQGVVTNNIVQNCGSGIYVYGSTFFLSSSNVLMGPASEFLPSPDILNSAFDSININLTAHGNSMYTSDSMVYQENGAAFDLTNTSIGGQNPELIYRVFYIQKSEKGVEEAYGTGTTAGNFIPGIRYMITDTTGTTPAQWNTAAGTSNVIYENGDSFKAQTAGTGPGKATSGGVDAIQFTDEAGTFRELGEFRFQINETLVNSIFDASGAYSYSTLKAANTSVTSEHVGIAWTASHRNYVKAAEIQSGSWLATNAANTATYTFTVANQKYLSIGRTVRVHNYGDWRNRADTTSDPIQYSGKIVTIDGDQIGVVFKGTGIHTPDKTVASTNLIEGTGSNGTLNIVDEFILAKGRII
jgi:hypothetical protein